MSRTVADSRQSLVEQGFSVKAFDVYPPSLEAVVKKGATPAASPVEAAKDVSVLALMVVNAKQVEDIIFGTHQVAHGSFATAREGAELD